MEYHTVVSVPSSELTPPPHSSLAGEGVGGANSEDRPETLALCNVRGEIQMIPESAYKSSASKN